MTKQNNITIRKAVEADSYSISRLLYEAFLEFKDLYTTEAFDATAISQEVVEKRIKEGPLWVTELKVTIVGTVSLVIKDRNAYLRGMAVDPSFRGQKIGFHLLQQAENYAKEKNCTALKLSTTPFLDRAIVLYERFGFVKTKGGPHDLFGTPLISMQKSLLGT